MTRGARVHDSYDPNGYQPSGDPRTPLDDHEIRYCIRFGHP